MYNALPKNEKTISVNLEGETTGLPYVGEFTIKCVLSMADKHGMELEKTRLMADYANPSAGLAGIAIALSNIRVKIIKGPEWWTDSEGGAKLLDENVVFELFNQCNKVEKDWRDGLKKEAKEAQKGNAQKESSKKSSP